MQKVSQKILSPNGWPLTRRHFFGFTLPEVIIAGTLSSLAAVGLISLSIAISRNSRSIYYQQRCNKEIQAVVEGINREIRLATAPLRVVDDGGNAVLRGNCVQFNRAGEAVGRRQIQIVSTDADLMTSWDNRLIFDPDTSNAGDERVIARWVTSLQPGGAFSYSGPTQPLTVGMRVGDPVGVDPKPSDVITGPGMQGGDINITVGPRN